MWCVNVINVDLLYTWLFKITSFLLKLFHLQAKHRSLRNTFQRHYICAAEVTHRPKGVKVHTIYSYNTFKVKEAQLAPY